MLQTICNKIPDRFDNSSVSTNSKVKLTIVKAYFDKLGLDACTKWWALDLFHKE